MPGSTRPNQGISRWQWNVPNLLAETSHARLEEFRDNTADLIRYYRSRGLLCEVSGEGDIEQIYHNIVRALRSRPG